MYQRILVPVDGSQGALNALEHAARLQQDNDAQLLLLCVFKHHSLFEASLSMVRPNDVQLPDDALKEYASSVADQAKQLATKAGARNVRAFVKGGRPSRAIIRFAKDNNVDLIIVGSHGRHGISLILGSTATGVLHGSQCDVLAVRV